jgi:hypothetical protein
MYNKPFLIKMKLSQLKQIIQEEIQDSLKETSSKKQTAVDLLVSILNKDGFTPVLTDEEIQQALKMEKEQIENAYDMGYLDYQNLTYDSAEEYYNGTYKR